MTKLIAQVNLAPDGGYRGFGPLGLEGNSSATTADVTFATFISSVIGVISIVAIIWFTFVLLTGGISYLSAGADKGAVESARKRIANGLIGLLITLFGLVLLNLIGYLIGIPSILNISDFINTVSGNVVQ